MTQDTQSQRVADWAEFGTRSVELERVKLKSEDPKTSQGAELLNKNPEKQTWSIANDVPVYCCTYWAPLVLSEALSTVAERHCQKGPF